jgi:FKBP-type peptidyl-prolyl cis-trans isomerase
MDTFIDLKFNTNKLIVIMIHSKLTLTVTAFAVVFSLMIAGCDSESYSGGDADLETNIDSVSYAFGYLNGQQMKQQGMNDLDSETFAEGMNEAMNAEEGDSAVIAQSEMMAMLQRYQMKSQEKMRQGQKQDAAANTKEAEAFLKENGAKDGVETTDSGLQYEVMAEGDGTSPTAEDTVIVNYAGTLLDGEEFDSGESVEIPLNNVIPGWTEGIQLMSEGANYKFWIPGELAYGPNPRPGGPIGPNEMLIFDVELQEVK